MNQLVTLYGKEFAVGQQDRMRPNHEHVDTRGGAKMESGDRESKAEEKAGATGIDQTRRKNQRNKVRRKPIKEGRFEDMLQAETSHLEKQCEAMDRKIEWLQSCIEKQERRMGSYANFAGDKRKHKLGKHNVSLVNKNIIARKLCVVEQHIEKLARDYNTMMGVNSSIKAQIDTFRREKLVFEKAFGRLALDLRQKQACIFDCSQKIAEHYKARDRAQHEMHRLRDEFTKKRTAYKDEWFQLSSALDAQRENKLVEPPIRTGVITPQREQGMKEQVVRKSWQTGKDKTILVQAREKLANLQSQSRTLIKECGVSSMNELVERFIEIEDENFTKLETSNKLSIDLESMRQQVSSLKQELEMYTNQEGREEEQRRKIVQNLKLKVEDTEKQNQDMERHLERKSLMLSQLTGCIEDLAQLLFHGQHGFSPVGVETSSTSFSRTLRTGLDNDTSVLELMGMIELEINEIIQLFVIRAAPTDRERMHLIAQCVPSPSTSAGETNINVLLPTALNHSSSNEESSDATRKVQVDTMFTDGEDQSSSSFESQESVGDVSYDQIPKPVSVENLRQTIADSLTIR